MKTSHTVFLNEAGVDLGSEVTLTISSDSQDKILVKGGGSAFMLNKKDIFEAINVLEQYFNPTPTYKYVTKLVELNGPNEVGDYEIP